MISYIIQVLSASIGSLGFGIIFKMKRRHLPAACLGGGATWIVYLLCMHFHMGLFAANLVATLFATTYAEILRRICKTPRTVFVIPSVVPLIPGSSLYYAMAAIVASNTERAEFYGVQTGTVSGAIAFGLLLFTALYNIFRTVQKSIQNKK